MDKSGNSQLLSKDDYSIFVRDFGVQADGMTDDTSALQQLFDSIDGPRTIIFPQKSNIIISKPIIITKSNLTLECNGTTFMYTGKQALDHNNGTERYYAAIMFKGEVLDQVKTVTNFAQYTGYVDPSVTLGQNNYGGLQNPPDTVSKITISASEKNDLVIGDYVSVHIKNYSDSYDKNYQDNPAELNNILSKVIAIDGQDIFVDIASDFIFDHTQLQTICKVDVLNNLSVNNFCFKDINETPIGYNPTSQEQSSWVSGLKFIRCANVKVNNFFASKHRFPALSMWQVHNYSITNSQACDARYLGPGCGYLMQLMATSHGIISRASGKGIRHLVDLSASGHILIVESEMVNNWLNAFDCHGTGEFDITYKDCNGNFLFGNNIQQFPNMTASVRLISCTGSVTANWIYSLMIDNSKIGLFNFNNVQRIVNISISNSIITSQDKTSKIFASCRGAYYDSDFSIYNSSIRYDSKITVSDSSAIRLEGYSNVQLNNIREITNNSSVFQLIQLLRCNKINISNVFSTMNIGFYVNNRSTAGSEIVSPVRSQNGHMLVQNVSFANTTKPTAVPNFINIDNMDDVNNYTINFTNNYLTALAETRWLRLNTGFPANVLASFNCIQGYVSGYLNVTTAPQLKTVNNIDESMLDTSIKN